MTLDPEEIELGHEFKKRFPELVEKADYYGTWAASYTFNAEGIGPFVMFIESRGERPSIDGRIREGIEGVIEDYAGKATFLGYIDNGIIFFIKTYDEEALKNNVHSGGIIYKGRKTENGFEGAYEALRANTTVSLEAGEEYMSKPLTERVATLGSNEFYLRTPVKGMDIDDIALDAFRD